MAAPTLNLALKLRSSTWKCFSYESISSICLKYLKEANEKEHDLFGFTITEASVHGTLATSLRDYGRAKLLTLW